MTQFTGFAGGGFSPVTRAANGTYSTIALELDLNVGREFYYDDFAVESGKSITGVRLWWAGGTGPVTLRCRLYVDSGGTTLASTDVDVDGAGEYTAVFSSPILMTSDYAYRKLFVGMWETTGTWYSASNTFASNTFVETSGETIKASPGLYWTHWADVSGNNPLTTGGSYPYAIEPTFDILDMSTIRDKTRIRKTYSYQRTKPVLGEDIGNSSSQTDTTIYVSGYFEGGWSPVSRARDGSYDITLETDSINAGRQFHYDDFAAASGNSIIGVRFWWPGDVGEQTIRCRLYSDNGTTTLESTDITVNSAGVYDAIFTTPVLLTTALAYTIMTVAMWETSGTYYVSSNTNVTDRYEETSSITICASPGLYWDEWVYGVGNSDPTSISSNTYAIEPIFDIA